MLQKFDATATIAVRNIDAARSFYEDTLGLKKANDEEPGAITFTSGNSSILVYESEYAGTNQATTATWLVDDLAGLVRDLRSKGVAFEHYDLPDTARDGDIHIAGDVRIAWLKDPDGNILALLGR